MKYEATITLICKDWTVFYRLGAIKYIPRQKGKRRKGRDWDKAVMATATRRHVRRLVRESHHRAVSEIESLRRRT
jgi:hypothetical protein